MMFEDAQDAWDLFRISPELTCTCDEVHVCQHCMEQYKDEQEQAHAENNLEGGE